MAKLQKRRKQNRQNRQKKTTYKAEKYHIIIYQNNNNDNRDLCLIWSVCLLVFSEAGSKIKLTLSLRHAVRRAVAATITAKHQTNQVMLDGC